MLFRKKAIVATGSLLLFTLTSLVSAAFPKGHNVIQYWGQNSAGSTSSQKNLAYYCDSSTDVIIISFLVQFNVGKLPVLNIANSCVGSTFPGTELLKCDKIGRDIKTCQSRGKKVLLSLGGASGAYGFRNNAEAKKFAKTLWNLFGGGHSKTRPFGTAVIDGFDLDIEGGGSTGYVTLVKELRSLFKKDRSKHYYITAAPQCPYPDVILGSVINSVGFDAIHVQFYNNYCALGTSSFNFAAWDKWAKTSSPNKKVKIFIGIPGSKSAAGSGYVSFAKLKSTVNMVRSRYSSYGGVVIWDASQSYKNKAASPNYAAAVGKLVHGSNSKKLRSSKAMTLSTHADPAATVTGPATPSVKEGEICSMDGQSMCVAAGDGVWICEHGKWAVRPCASAYACLPTTDGLSAYCGPVTPMTNNPHAFYSSSSYFPKAYVSTTSSVTAQFVVTQVTNDTMFDAVINARRTDSLTSFGSRVSIQITMPPNMILIETPLGTVQQIGRDVQINIKNQSTRSMTLVVPVRGMIESGSVFMAPESKNIKFLS
ncbi:glycoside hydrolase superfamily [Dichotomocladium elegans]|nr:glycoside hydrolase superfamily [Dichotomocladium elegans]